MLKAGQFIDGFELVCPIGEGGMAHVWAAKQRGPGGDRLVALKIIHSRFVEDPTFRTMFLDEGRIVAGIDHPNVARVYDLVESKDQLYLVMEYVDGESLFHLVSQYRTAPLPFALKVCADAAAGLHAAHSLTGPDGRARNVVHRDVSPQNILVSVTGEVKVIDFGIAHARDRAAQTTALGTVKGKIRYMAPEQAKRGELGPYTDVFGIGATLFRILVGKPPYSAESDVMTMQALLQGAPPLVPLPPELPAPVVEVIKQAIAPDPAQRFASAAALQRALTDVLSKSGERADVVGFVMAQMSEKAKARRQQLAGLVAPDLPAVTPKGTAVMAPMAMANAPTEPERKRDPVATAPTEPDRKRDPVAAPKGTAVMTAREPAPPAVPGFMDVHAIVAGAKNVPDLPAPAPRPAPRAEATAAGGDPAPAEPKLELAYEPSNRAPEKTSNAAAFRIAIGVAVLVVLGFIVLFAVPSIAKSRAVGTAREAGFDMTVEDVSVGLSTVTLRNVKLKAIKVPNVTGSADEIHIKGFSIKEMRVTGLAFTVEGPPSDWEMGLGLMLQENRVRFAGTPTAPKKYVIANGRVAWKGPNGAGFEANGLGVTIDTKGNGLEEVHGSVDKTFYRTGKTALGPWGTSFDVTASSSRLRVALDPAVPDGPSLMIVTSATAPAQITANIGRSTFANLGLDPQALGLPADGSTEIEAKIVGTATPDGKVALGGPISLWGLKVKDVPKPLDVKANVSVSGALGSTLDIDQTSTISFGPFVAGLSGTVTAKDGNVRVDVLAKATPIPCATLARAELKTMGNFGQMLSALGQDNGIVRIIGSVNASCAVQWDSGKPEETSVTWVAKETCGLSLFGK